MTLRRAAVILVLLALLPGSPLAFAMPIDPSYPGGLYDNGDLDDVIEFLCGPCATVVPVLAHVEPLWIAVEVLSEAARSTFIPRCRSPRDTRAPPAAPLLAA